MLLALAKVLVSEGATVTCVQEGKEAVDLLAQQRKPVDLLITDLRLPVTSGLTVVAAVHNIFPKLPIIVLTAFGSPFVKAESLRQGAAAFLEKPVDSPKLLNAIIEVLHPQESARLTGAQPLYESGPKSLPPADYSS